ncbi:MAG TPA: serine/threonine-protein kinase [Pseudonocardiaceae bacterium]|jgi:serine/threonine protein kinase|nr:serine/threonine-protein kinase [Pseudonocardiaceae bacterium]
MDKTYELDDEDGEPIWGFQEGERMPGGALAVGRFGVGVRCETWLAWSTDPWCPVVVKLARPHLTGHPRAIRTLRRESAALSGAGHPAMPRLIADSTAEAVPHLVMEYLDGPTLDDELDRTGPMAPVEAALLGSQILTVIIDLHRRGLAHLDLKPENVILRDGRPVVIDYGSTRVIGTPQPAGHPIGTTGYAAPEQEACRPVSSTMDCFGVGAILYEALTGEATGPNTGLDAVAAELRPVVTALLDPDPDERMTARDAMIALAYAVPEDRRPWPKWADRHLRVATPPLAVG